MESGQNIDVYFRVTTKDRTAEELVMIQSALLMIKGVVSVWPDPEAERKFVVHGQDLNVRALQAIIVIEGVVKTERMRPEEAIPS